MSTTAFHVDVSSVAGLTVLKSPEIDGPLVLRPRRHGDDRGYFCEVFKTSWFRDLGIAAEFLQDNQSMSAAAGVVRGLHFQAPPMAQGKLVRVLKGAIFDAIVDIRAGSPTYGRSVSVVLDAAHGDQFWVPPGFAHGFATLEPHTEVLYKVTAPYAPALEGGLQWNDPALGIDWPVQEAAAQLSARDQTWPSFSAFETPFSTDSGT